MIPRKSVLAFSLFISMAELTAQETQYRGHGVDSISAEVLAKFVPKPLPSELARQVQMMMDVRSPGMGIPSPDGSQLYFTWSVTGTLQVWRLEGPDRFPVQMTGGEDRTNIADITPDGKTLIIQRDRKGEENPGLYTMPADGESLAVVQHGFTSTPMTRERTPMPFTGGTLRPKPKRPFSRNPGFGPSLIFDSMAACSFEKRPARSGRNTHNGIRQPKS